MKTVSKNTKETREIAKKFLTKIKPNKVGATIVGLYGELGAGKTTFTQFLTKELGVKRKVNSPTFVIMKKYLIPKNYKKEVSFKKIFHIDAYRLKNEKELIHLGWEEIILNNTYLVLIEWPEQIIKAMPKNHYKINIFHTKNGFRKFEIKNI